MADDRRTADIRRIFGLARDPKLRLNEEELHILVERCTGKSSIRSLDSRERSAVVRELLRLKDGAAQDQSRSKGRSTTENQRAKIYKLAEALGWDTKNRINGMCRRMFGVAAVEWLTYQQCSKLIEAMKAMLARKEGEHGAETQEADAGRKEAQG